MTNHEKALKTFKEIQRRKIEKARKLESDLDGYMQDSFYKCFNSRHDLKIYR